MPAPFYCRLSNPNRFELHSRSCRGNARTTTSLLTKIGCKKVAGVAACASSACQSIRCLRQKLVPVLWTALIELARPTMIRLQDAVDPSPDNDKKWLSVQSAQSAPAGVKQRSLQICGSHTASTPILGRACHCLHQRIRLNQAPDATRSGVRTRSTTNCLPWTKLD